MQLRTRIAKLEHRRCIMQPPQIEISPKAREACRSTLQVMMKHADERALIEEVQRSHAQ